MKLQLKRSWFALAGLVVASLFSMINLFCDFLGLGSNSGLEEDFFARVQGKLHINAVLPEQTDELFLALVKGTSPKFTTTIPRIDLNLQASEQFVDFIIEAQADTFDALFAIWKKRGRPLSVIENIIGSSCEEGALIPLQIATNDTIINIDTVDVNLEKLNRVAGISGVIEFQGDWPADIDNLGIVFADSTLILSIVESFFSKGKIEVDICTLLNHADIHIIKERDVDSLRIDFKVAPGLTLMIVAMNKKGGSIFEPVILTKIDLSTILASLFTAIKDSTISGLRSVAQFQ